MQISDIVNGIAIKLDSAFPDSTIYTEEVPNSFSGNSFIIQLINFETIRRLSDGFRFTPMFDIQHFPTGGATQAADVSLRVQLALTDITLVNNVIMVNRAARTEIVEGEHGDVVGHNFMRFDFDLHRRPAENFMQQLTHTVNRERVNQIG